MAGSQAQADRRGGAGPALPPGRGVDTDQSSAKVRPRGARRAGGRDVFGRSIDLGDLNGADGFVVVGEDTYDRLGSAVSGAGDVDGDGFEDLIVAAPGAAGDGVYLDSGPGAAYIVFGSPDRFPARIDPASLDGTNGLALIGAARFDGTGAAVAGVGDVDGDGLADLLVAGGRDVTFSEGEGRLDRREAHVVFGRKGGLGATLALQDLAGRGRLALFGDGFDDLVVDAPE